MKKVRIGIIGCGKVTERLHLPGFSKVKNVEIVALADSDLLKARKLGAAFKIPVIFKDYRYLLKFNHIDAICVCTPNRLHCRMTCDAFAAGKHVLVEKPMATNMNEVRRMKAAADRAKKILMVAQLQRFMPINSVARKFISSGRLGKVFAFRGRIGHGGPENWAPDGKWFFDSREAFGGALADIGIHMIDMLRWISGKEAASVVACIKTLRKKTTLDDNAAFIVECADGAIGTVEASWTQEPGELTYTFYGDGGNLVNENYERLIFHPRGKKAVRLAMPKRNREGTEFEHFARCILKNEKPLVDGAEGGRSLEIILAAYKSGKTGRRIKLPLA